MFLRPNHRAKDGKDHTYWSLVETVRTADGPRQRTLCYLGELNSSAEARRLTTIEVFNQQGETEQLKPFPSHVTAPGEETYILCRASAARKKRKPFGIAFPTAWKQH